MSHLSSRAFDDLRALLLELSGISLNEHKRELVRGRLASRLRAVGAASFSAYHRVLRDHDPDGVERREMVNAMTTNKTSFFREPYQFDWLREVAFPAFKARAARGGSRRVRAWSAACSTGAEPYTIAMLLRESFGPEWSASVLATDIDTEVLATAAAGVFAGAQLEGLDDRAIARHFLRGRGASQGKVKVRPELRRLVTFRQTNLLEAAAVSGPFELIFCRNACIYFDRDTQIQVFASLADKLTDGGHLLVGHSECLTGMALPLEPLRGNVYRKAPPAARAAGRVRIGSIETARAPAELVAQLDGTTAVCLYDPAAPLGGVAHLPGADAAGGSGALARLVLKLRTLGATPTRLAAKVVASSDAALAAVEQLLEGHGVELVDRRVLRRRAADVRFLPTGGRVRLAPRGDK